MLIGIYKIENKINGMKYIGRSKCIENRWKQHLNHLQEENHHCSRLQYDYSKYGILNFNFEVLELCNLDNISDREQYWMDYYEIPHLYNSVKSNKKFGVQNKNNIIMFPKNIVFNYKTIQSLRILFYIIKAIHEQDDNCIEIQINEISSKFDITNEALYKSVKDIINDLKDIKIDKDNLIDVINYEDGLFEITVNKLCFDYISDLNNNINLKITYDDIIKINNKRTFGLLYSLCMNNGVLDYEIDDFRKQMDCESNSYNRFNNITQKIINPIKDEFKNMNISLNIKNNYKGVKIVGLNISC